MRILMLLDREFPPDIRVENEALSLISEGHTVHVLSYNFGNLPSSGNHKGILISRFSIHKQLAKKSLGLILVLPLFKLIWKRAVLSLLKELSFDAIHIHDLPLCILAKNLKSKGYKVVADMHENYPFLVSEQSYMKSRFAGYILRKRCWFRKEREWLSSVDTVISVDEGMKDRLQKVIGEKKIIVVPNSYNFQSFHKDQEDVPNLNSLFKNEFVITYIGGFDEIRGIDLLIRALSKVKDTLTDIKLLLVGDGSNFSNLAELTKQLALEGRVIFTGWQPTSFMKSYIQASSVCVIPHLRSVQTDNSSPNKLFQYMVCGKPVITSNCTSLERIILQEECGLVFSDKNVDDLVEKILFLHNHPEICHQMGMNGTKAVMERYNWDVTVRALCDEYTS